MATLKLTSLECIRRHDAFGSDEPRVMVNNDVAWSGSMNKGETEVLTGGRSDEYQFGSTIDVWLTEWSDGQTVSIGSRATVDNDPTNNGKAVFKNSGTHYELEYRVLA